MGDLRALLSFQGESSGFKSSEGKTTFAYLDFLKNSCKHFDADLVVVDLTKSRVKIPTVRIIIPGISELCNLQFNFEGDEKFMDTYVEGSIVNFEILEDWYGYLKDIFNTNVGEPV
jgi:hypothetical protein